MVITRGKGVGRKMKRVTEAKSGDGRKLDFGC